MQSFGTYKIETLDGDMRFTFTAPLEKFVDQDIKFCWDYLDQCPADWKVDAPWIVHSGNDLLNDNWKDLHHVQFHTKPGTEELWMKVHFYNWNYDGPQFKCCPCPNADGRTNE